MNPYIYGHNVSYTKKIAEYLSECEYDVTLLTCDEFYENIENVKIIKLNDDSNKYKNQYLEKLCKIKYYKKILQLNNDSKYDIIHFLYLDVETIPMVFSYLELKRIKKVSKIVGTIHWSTNIIGYKGFKRKSKLFLFSILNKFFDLYFVHGKNAKYDLTSIQKINEDKVKVIPYGTERFKYVNKTKCKEFFGFDINTKVFLMFGSISEYKGFDILSKALDRIDTNIILLLAGVPVNNEAEINILNYKNVEIVKYLHYIENNKIPLFFGAADVLLLPYKKHVSGQSGPLTIATTYGIPTLGTDVGEIGITIRDYGLGEVIEPENVEELVSAINRFSNYPKSEFLKYRRNCKVYSDSNTWEMMCNLIKSSYEYLMREDIENR